jgi:hypothetical protein
MAISPARRTLSFLSRVIAVRSRNGVFRELFAGRWAGVTFIEATSGNLE